MDIKNIFLDEIDSTQTWAKDNFRSFDQKIITSITADKQTNGFGRYKRKWISPKNMCLTSTFYFTIPSDTKDFFSLALVTCISLTTVLASYNLSPKIKWPNDIMIDEKKIGGALCQTQFDRDIIHLFLGIGVNINMDEKTANQIDQKSTSIFLETNQKQDILNFLPLLQKQFAKDLNIFLNEGFLPFKKIYENLLLYKNKEITLFDGKDHFHGILDSITDSGAMQLKLNDGTIKTFQSGDINL